MDRQIRRGYDQDGQGATYSMTYGYIAYDGTERLVEFYDQDGFVGPVNPSYTRRYIYAQCVDQVLSTDNAGNLVRWGLADHEGTVRDVISSSGSQYSHRIFDSFGVVKQGPIDTDFPLAFAGEPYDTVTQLARHGKRCYAPAMGRFLSEDPIPILASDPNRYRYSYNNPMTMKDPSGQCAQPYTGFLDGAPGYWSPNLDLRPILAAQRPSLSPSANSLLDLLSGNLSTPRPDSSEAFSADWMVSQRGAANARPARGAASSRFFAEQMRVQTSVAYVMASEHYKAEGVPEELIPEMNAQSWEESRRSVLSAGNEPPSIQAAVGWEERPIWERMTREHAILRKIGAQPEYASWYRPLTTLEERADFYRSNMNYPQLVFDNGCNTGYNGMSGIDKIAMMCVAPNPGAGVQQFARIREVEAPEGTRVRGARLGQQQGREFRVDQLETYQFDPNQPKHVRGWLQNEQRRIAGSGGGPDIPRTPSGYVQGHGRTTPAREGFDYSNSKLQGQDLNILQERIRRRAGVP